MKNDGLAKKEEESKNVGDMYSFAIEEETLRLDDFVCRGGWASPCKTNYSSWVEDKLSRAVLLASAQQYNSCMRANIIYLFILFSSSVLAAFFRRVFFCHCLPKNAVLNDEKEGRGGRNADRPRPFTLPANRARGYHADIPCFSSCFIPSEKRMKGEKSGKSFSRGILPSIYLWNDSLESDRLFEGNEKTERNLYLSCQVFLSYFSFSVFRIFRLWPISPHISHDS